MPAKQEFAQNPAIRPGTAQPVPRSSGTICRSTRRNKILDKASFIYDSDKDRYLCPMVPDILHSHDKPYNRDGVKGTYRMYQSRGLLLAAIRWPTSACRKNARLGSASAADEFELASAELDGVPDEKRRGSCASTSVAPIVAEAAPSPVFKTAMNFPPVPAAG